MRTIKSLSIKQKLTLYFLVFFCLPLLIFGSIWYNRSVSQIEKNTINLTEQLIQQMSDQLDKYFADIRSDTSPLPGHPLIQQFIKLNSKDSYEKYRLTEQMNNDLYQKLMYSRKDVIGYSIMTSQGNSFGTVDMRSRINDWTAIGAYEQNYGIVGAHRTNSGFPVVTVYRIIIDNYYFQITGIIGIDFSMDPILKIVAPANLKESVRVSIVDRNDRYLYHQDRKKIGTEIDGEWNYSITDGQKHFFANDKQKDSLNIYINSVSTGLTVISEIPKKDLIGNLAELRFIILGVGAVILLLAYTMFHKMLIEIRQLAREIPQSRIKEKEMELKQREAVMQAMQAQINPHFLFNTLEIINSHAVIARIKPISKIVLKLAEMFRYSISDSHLPVPLRKEINHIESYISIQQERYEDLRFVLDIDDIALDHVQTFCLTVQPIIENAILHGYDKHKLSPGELFVIGRAKASYFSLLVRNGGVGMSSDTMKAYNDQFNSAMSNRELQTAERNFSSIGLWNVHSRLRMAFGAPFGLHITYSGTLGTEIEIRLPYISNYEGEPHV